jgi:hypothetical protein
MDMRKKRINLAGRRILSVGVFLIALIYWNTGLFAQSNQTCLGDANVDNQVNITDSVRITRHITGAQILSSQGLSNADVNRDTQVNVVDVVRVVRHIIGIEPLASCAPTPPPPSPPSSGFNIPANTWVVRKTPAFPGSPGGGGSKHVRLTYDTDKHAIYLWGGDYCVSNPLTESRCASHEEFWSYDVATDKWELILDQLAADKPGYPKGRCWPAMVYDPKRKVVWMTTGDERHSPYSPNLQSGGLWAFDLARRTWSREGPNPDQGDAPCGSTKVCTTQTLGYGVYDSINDQLYFPTSAGFTFFDLRSVAVQDGVSNDNWSAQEFAEADAWFSMGPMSGTFARDTKRNRAIHYLPLKGETWSYNFVTKTATLLSRQKITPEHGFGMHYDSANDVVILFGGGSGELATENYTSDVYVFEFNTNAWRKLQIGGPTPTPRFGAQSVYDPHNNAFVVYADYMGKLWDTAQDGQDIYLLRLDLGGGGTQTGNTSPSDATPPAVNISAPSIGASVSGTITISATASDNTGVAGVQFKLNGANIGAEDTSSPYALSWDTTTAANGSHALTAVARDSSGNSTISSAVTVSVKNGAVNAPTPTAGVNVPANTWVKVNPPESLPNWRAWTSLRYDDATGVFVFYGADEAEGRIYSNALWFYDVALNRWTKEPKPFVPSTTCSGVNWPDHPFERHPGGSTSYDPVEKVLVQYSGACSGPEPRDTWHFDVVNKVWREATSSIRPPEDYVWAGTLMYDPGSRMHIRVFDNNARWRYNAATKIWTESPAPATEPARRGETAAALDEASRQIIQFGGDSGNMGQTWVYDIARNTWTNANPPVAPLRRSWPAMAYDPVNQVVLLYGGSSDSNNTSNSYDDTWVYDVKVNRWTKLSPGSTPGYLGSSSAVPFYTLAYDRRNNVFGLALLNPQTFKVDLYLFRYQP